MEEAILKILVISKKNTYRSLGKSAFITEHVLFVIILGAEQLVIFSKIPISWPVALHC
jgi:hypothetical protein